MAIELASAIPYIQSFSKIFLWDLFDCFIVFVCGAQVICHCYVCYARMLLADEFRMIECVSLMEALRSFRFKHFSSGSEYCESLNLLYCLDVPRLAQVLLTYCICKKLDEERGYVSYRTYISF